MSNTASSASIRKSPAANAKASRIIEHHKFREAQALMTTTYKDLEQVYTDKNIDIGLGGSGHEQSRLAAQATFLVIERSMRILPIMLEHMFHEDSRPTWDPDSTNVFSFLSTSKRRIEIFVIALACEQMFLLGPEEFERKRGNKYSSEEFTKIGMCPSERFVELGFSRDLLDIDFYELAVDNPNKWREIVNECKAAHSLDFYCRFEVPGLLDIS